MKTAEISFLLLTTKKIHPAQMKDKWRNRSSVDAGNVLAEASSVGFNSIHAKYVGLLNLLKDQPKGEKFIISIQHFFLGQTIEFMNFISVWYYFVY